jgi:hypothetical protein
MKYGEGAKDFDEYGIPRFIVAIKLDLNKCKNQEVFFTKEPSPLAKGWGATPSLDWIAWLKQFEIQPDRVQDMGSYKYPEAHLSWFNEEDAKKAFNILAMALEVLDRSFLHYPQI